METVQPVQCIQPKHIWSADARSVLLAFAIIPIGHTCQEQTMPFGLDSSLACLSSGGVGPGRPSAKQGS